MTPQPTTVDNGDDFLGNLSMTAVIGIFGGAFIALVVGFICVFIFVRKMQKGDREEANSQQRSIQVMYSSEDSKTTLGEYKR